MPKMWHFAPSMTKDSKREISRSIPAPGVYVRWMLRHFGTTPERRRQLLAGTDVDEERLKDTGADVTLFTFISFSENLSRVVGPMWPLEAMPAWSAAMQGALEVAVRSSATVGDALEVLTRFGSVRAPYVAPQLVRSKTTMRFVIKPALAISDVAWRAMSETVAYGVAAMIVGVFEGRTEGVEFQFAWPAPKHAAQVRAVLPGKIIYDAREFAIAVPNELCGHPSPFADPALLATAIAELEQSARRVRGSDTLLLKVERLFKQRRTGRLTEEAAADALGLSRRTLVRRLSEGGTTFRALLDENLKQRARQMLDDDKLSREDMAEALGFADPTSFSRACRRWFKATSPKPKPQRKSFIKRI